MTSLAQQIFNLETLLFSDDSPQVMAPEKQSFSIKDLIDTFPQAKSVIKQMIKEDIELVEKNQEIKTRIGNDLYRRLPSGHSAFATELAFAVARTDFIEHKSRNKMFKEGEYAEERLERNKKLLRLMELPKDMTADFGAKIARAKAYPIESLVKTTAGGMLRCPIVAEKTPSFKIYKAQNRFHCFSCGADGDVIDLMGKISNCTFKEAVLKLQ